MKQFVFAAAVAAFLPVMPAHAVISVGAVGFSYGQDFNTLASSGTSSAWTNDSTLAGWSLFNKTPSAITTYGVDNGGNNAGSFYSFGATGSSERALGGTGSGGTYFGSPSSGAVAGWIAVAFQNNSGFTLSRVTLGFDGEQWRNGGNASAQTMVLQYGFGSTFAAVANWITPGGTFNWTSPIATATAAAVNGNGAGRVAGRGGALESLTWTNGQTMWVRWVENNDVGNDHGLAIDNFTMTAVPEPETYAMLFAGLAAIGLVIRRRID